MLDNHATLQLAEAHLRTYHEPGGLQVVPLCELDDPPGVYYGVRLVDPGDGILLGDGGFFVHRRDGAIRKFGSGDVVEACRALDSKHGFIPDMEISPPVVRFLLEHYSESPSVRPSKRWWQF